MLAEYSIEVAEPFHAFLGATTPAENNGRENVGSAHRQKSSCLSTGHGFVNG